MVISGESSQGLARKEAMADTVAARMPDARVGIERNHIKGEVVGVLWIIGWSKVLDEGFWVLQSDGVGGQGRKEDG